MNAAPVTIGMPVYNAARWLRQSIGSLLAQSFSNFELIISDNASTDETADICHELAGKDSRIKYIRQPGNIGVFRNYDAVFYASNSPYFKWASGNDICGETLLEKCISALEFNGDAVLAYSDTVLFDDETGYREVRVEDFDLDHPDPIVRYQNFLDQAGLNNIMNGVIRSVALHRTSLNAVVMASDVNMIAELLLLGPAIHIREQLFYRRFSQTASISVRTDSEKKQFYAYEPSQTARLQATKLHVVAVVGALRAPKQPNVRLRALLHALRRMWWGRPAIASELKEWLSYWLGR